MDHSSDTGAITRATSFVGWSEEERLGFLVLYEWRNFFTQLQGFSAEFRSMDIDKVRDDPLFQKFVEVAVWLKSQGKSPAAKSSGWKMYLHYVCGYYLSLRRRPSPLHLKSPLLLKRFNQGAGHEVRKEEGDRKALFSRYRKALDPNLRDSACIKVLGFDQL